MLYNYFIRLQRMFREWKLHLMLLENLSHLLMKKLRWLKDCLLLDLISIRFFLLMKQVEYYPIIADNRCTLYETNQMRIVLNILLGVYYGIKFVTFEFLQLISVLGVYSNGWAIKIILTTLLRDLSSKKFTEKLIKKRFCKKEKNLNNLDTYLSRKKIKKSAHLEITPRFIKNCLLRAWFL